MINKRPFSRQVAFYNATTTEKYLRRYHMNFKSFHRVYWCLFKALDAQIEVVSEVTDGDVWAVFLMQRSFFSHCALQESFVFNRSFLILLSALSYWL